MEHNRAWCCVCAGEGKGVGFKEHSDRREECVCECVGDPQKSSMKGI